MQALGGHLGRDVDVFVGGRILAVASDSGYWFEKMTRTVGGHRGVDAVGGYGLA